MLGHASAVMTLDRYGHLMPGRAQDVADRLDALARAAVPDPILPVVGIHARNFRGMEPKPPLSPETVTRPSQTGERWWSGPASIR
jgi:hypothetical protein